MQPFHCLSDPRSHHRRCGLDPTAVSPAPPFSQVFAFDRARERCVRAMAPRTQRCPRSGEAVPWGFSAADAWKMASRYTWGSCDRTTTGHFCLSLPQVRLLMLLLIVVNRRTRASARCSFTQRVELLPREVLQQLMKNAIVMAHGIDPQLVSGSFPNNPGPVESMPCAMYSQKCTGQPCGDAERCGRVDI